MRKLYLLILAAMLSQVSHAQKGVPGYQIDSAVVETKTLVKQEKRVYEYDDAGRQAVCYRYWYKDGWQLLNKDLTSYNENGVLEKEETFKWDTDAEAFTLVESTEVTEYNAENGQPSVTVHSNWVQYQFEKYVVTKYNGRQPEDLDVYQRDMVDDEVWNFYGNRHYEYYDDGSVKVKSSSVDYMGMFTISQTVVYEYDEHGNVVKEPSRLEPTELFGDEVDAESITYYQNEYDGIGNLTKTTEYNKNNIEYDSTWYYWSKSGEASIHNPHRLTLPSVCYDLTGRPVGTDRPKHGIYIRNGKKITVTR